MTYMDYQYTYPPQRDVCPGCGRCRVCGQPSHHPYWYQGPAIAAGGTVDGTAMSNLMDDE